MYEKPHPRIQIWIDIVQHLKSGIIWLYKKIRSLKF